MIQSLERGQTGSCDAWSMNFAKLEGLPVFTSHISRHCHANFAYVRVLRTVRHVLALSASGLRCIFDCRRYVFAGNVSTQCAAHWDCCVQCKCATYCTQVTNPVCTSSSLQSGHLLFWKCKVRRTLNEPAGVLHCLIRRRHTNTLTPCLYVCCVCSLC
jgi:hypothetical protein